MTDAPRRRGLFAICVVALVALVCLVIGHQWLQGYLERQHAKSPAGAAVPERSGVSGVVAFADGAPAPAARVAIAWRDSGGREGSTPSVTDDAGRFAQGSVPAHATVTGVQATLGPLVGRADAGALSREGTQAADLRITMSAEFRLAGFVRGAADRAAVAGATFDVGGAHATSAADGVFRIERIAASVLREERPVVRVAAEGFKPVEWPLPKDALPETYGDLSISLEAMR